MNIPHYQINNTFDPWRQTFTLLMPDGVTPFFSVVGEINAVQKKAILLSICQSTQVGGALILLLTLLLVTKEDKRRSIVFLLNSLALLFVVLRGVLSLCLYTGPFYDFYRWKIMYYDNIGNAGAISAAGEVMSFFLTLTIEASLVFQVRIVCCNLSTFRRAAINTFNTLVASIAVCIRFALMVLNIDWNIAHLDTMTNAHYRQLSALASATSITLATSIGISALIFCGKLWFAIEARRSMGMTQFGPMQIIFVMGCQTMCTPRKSRHLSQPTLNAFH